MKLVVINQVTLQRVGTQFKNFFGQSDGAVMVPSVGFGTKWNPVRSKIFQISTHASKLEIGNSFAGVNLVFPDWEGSHVRVEVSKKEDLHPFFFK